MNHQHHASRLPPRKINGTINTTGPKISTFIHHGWQPSQGSPHSRISLETTEPQTELQSTQSKQKSSAKQGKLLRILSHRQKGRAHQQRTKESKGNLQIQHAKALRVQFSHGGFTQIHENHLTEHR